MKLITEYRTNLKYLTEAKANGTKAVMIEGIFMQAETANRNRRVYPLDVLKRAVDQYVTEQVNTNRAVGELNHPDGPAINLDKVSHKITELRFEGNDVIGRAEVLNTPMGRIVKGLIEGEVVLGVSSRGMGSVKERSGVSVVQNDYSLGTVDIVQDPSAPGAFINGIMEGIEWIKTEDGSYQKFAEDTMKMIHNTPSNRLAEAQLKAWENFLKLL